MSLPAPFSTHPLPPPPRLLLVNKFAESRAPELESLHRIVSNRLNHDFCLRRDKRRRTTGFRSRKNNWRKKKRRIIDAVFSPVGDCGAVDVDLDEKKGSQEESRPSRRVRRRLELRKNPAFGFCVSVDGTKRLRTHLWHAKRFTMVKRWGFYLPLGLQGRGKGSRSILKRLKSGALVHDCSYSEPVLLEGPEESILDIMRMVLRPFPSSFSKTSKTVVDGACYANSMLYKDSSSLPKFIAPVIYMWWPLKSNPNYLDSEQLDGCTTSRSECSTSLRQLWIWIHAAALNEGLDTVRCACEKQMNDTGASVKCLSLEGHIAMFEVVGSKSLEILQKILIPVPELSKIGSQSLSSCSFLRPCSSLRPQSDFVLEHADHLPSHAIVSLEVQDPRYSSVKKSKITESDGTKKPEANGVFFSGNRQLWDSYLSLKPPLPENILCNEKHNKRLKQFYLDSANFGESGGVAKDNYDKSCPIILLKHADHASFGSRLSLILPLSWAKPFWMSLISNGAHAIGLREKRWIACSCGLPSFPFDFPDSSVYSKLIIAEATKAEEATKLRPPSVRPIDVPLAPPWHCVAHTLHGGSKTESQDNKQSSFEHSKESFTISIPRISNDLNFLLKGTCGDGNLGQGGGPFFVRVLIHAFKEGSFEEGAVVCAPALADLPAWSSRSDEHAPLHMPQSFVNSYFTRQDSETWELHEPQDSSTLQWFRWPIGFITTGFVRGSSKPAAVAFCEAKILKGLKEQQEVARDSVKNEIFVLVRNLKSNAYRHAVATIFLDQQEDDLDFM